MMSNADWVMIWQNLMKRNYKENHKRNGAKWCWKLKPDTLAGVTWKSAQQATNTDRNNIIVSPALTMEVRPRLFKTAPINLNSNANMT